MADDSHSRYRSSDPYAHGPAPAAPSNDPLAELARLIGQNDPFADYGRSPRPAAPPEPNHGTNIAPPYGHDTPQHYGTEAAPAYSQRPAPHYDPAPPYADDQTQHHDWYNSAPVPPAYPSNDQFAPPPPLPAALRPYETGSQPYATPDYGHQDYGTQGFAPPTYADPLSQPTSDRYQPEPAGFEPGYAPSPQQPEYPLYPQEPGAAPMPPPHDDEFYDDAPSGRRRGFVTVVAVLCLAVIGTAGAFAYRSWIGGSSAPATPPVIRASNEPSKVAPPPAPDQSANKFTYDRFGDAGKDEQLVRRDEKPLDLSKLTPPPAATAPRAQTGGSTANPPSAIGEPRRVRTVPIRPDQGDVAAVTPSTAGGPVPITPPRQAPGAAVSEPPRAVEPQQPAESAPQAPSRATSSRTSTRTARTTHTPAPAAANAPLSLSPDANNALPPPSAVQGSASPPRVAAPTRIAPASASGGSGSYLVQVSSQKSEADAESAYRGISSKYSSVLGGKPHTVRRADLGSKGVYYRAMIGPFASREDAVSLCTSLKQAGGDCVVQR